LNYALGTDVKRRIQLVEALKSHRAVTEDRKLTTLEGIGATYGVDRTVKANSIVRHLLDVEVAADREIQRPETDGSARRPQIVGPNDEVVGHREPHVDLQRLHQSSGARRARSRLRLAGRVQIGRASCR